MFQETGMDWSECRAHVDGALHAAEEAAKECIQLWANIGDLAKLADSWAAYAGIVRPHMLVA